MTINLNIGRKKLNNQNCLIIAEAGVNHNGSIKRAEKLIKTAKQNGADFIKFQTYKAEKLTIKKSPRFWNWKGEVNKKGGQFESYKKLDVFEYEDYKKLKKICDHYNIEFLSTPFDIGAVEMLKKVGVKAFKVASCDITNYPLLEKVAKSNLPILLSTGASNISEVKDSVKFINKFNKKICIMHCTLSYPTEDKFANLSAINDLKKKFKNNIIGFSDHTLGIEIPSASVAFGARIIEKHYTYNKNLKKSADHWLSINPKELEKLRYSVDRIMKSIGSGEKKVLKCELNTRKLARRSLVANHNLEKGSTLKKDDLISKRPGTGISPKYFKKILGKKLKKDIKEDSIIQLKDLV